MPVTTLSEVSALARQSVDQYRDAFLTAQPFKHVVIEDFFEPAFAEQLLAEFPSFDKALAINESGYAAGKSVNTDLSASVRNARLAAVPRFRESAFRHPEPIAGPQNVRRRHA
jgi:hypothetical protein